MAFPTEEWLSENILITRAPRASTRRSFQLGPRALASAEMEAGPATPEPRAVRWRYARLALLAAPAVLLLLAASDFGAAPELDASSETDGGRRLASRGRGWWKRRPKWRSRHAAWLEAPGGVDDALDPALQPLQDYARPTEDAGSATGTWDVVRGAGPLGFPPSALVAKITPSALVAKEATGGIPLEFCQSGLINLGGDVCCPSACGQCGGDGCSERDGGGGNCCVDPIHASGKLCGTATDLKCIMPQSCAQDKCLLECPYDPGCAVTWRRRGWTRGGADTETAPATAPAAKEREVAPPPAQAYADGVGCTADGRCTGGEGGPVVQPVVQDAVRAATASSASEAAAIARVLGNRTSVNVAGDPMFKLGPNGKGVHFWLHEVSHNPHPSPDPNPNPDPHPNPNP